MTSETDQGMGFGEQYIYSQKCESVDNHQQNTRVVEDIAGVYQLGNAIFFGNSEEEQ